MHARDEVRVEPARITTDPAAPAVDAERRILSLQQALGNASVTRLLQRRDSAASTDAPKKGGGKRPKKEAPAKEIHARVIGLSVVSGKTRIVISAAEGVEPGMAGSLRSPDGKELEDFWIAEVKGGTSIAYVNASQDQVSAHSQVVITPSKRKPRGPEDEHI